jgi:hypothetical protein
MADGRLEIVDHGGPWHPRQFDGVEIARESMVTPPPVLNKRQ